MCRCVWGGTVPRGPRAFGAPETPLATGRVCVCNYEATPTMGFWGPLWCLHWPFLAGIQMLEPRIRTPREKLRYVELFAHKIGPKCCKVLHKCPAEGPGGPPRALAGPGQICPKCCKVLQKWPGEDRKPAQRPHFDTTEINQSTGRYCKNGP